MSPPIFISTYEARSSHLSFFHLARTSLRSSPLPSLLSGHNLVLKAEKQQGRKREGKRIPITYSGSSFLQRVEAGLGRVVAAWKRTSHLHFLVYKKEFLFPSLPVFPVTEILGFFIQSTVTAHLPMLCGKCHVTTWMVCVAAVPQ